MSSLLLIRSSPHIFGKELYQHNKKSVTCLVSHRNCQIWLQQLYKPASRKLVPSITFKMHSILSARSILYYSVTGLEHWYIESNFFLSLCWFNWFSSLLSFLLIELLNFWYTLRDSTVHFISCFQECVHWFKWDCRRSLDLVRLFFHLAITGIKSVPRIKSTSSPLLRNIDLFANRHDNRWCLEDQQLNPHPGILHTIASIDPVQCVTPSSDIKLNSPLVISLVTTLYPWSAIRHISLGYNVLFPRIPVFID